MHLFGATYYYSLFNPQCVSSTSVANKDNKHVYPKDGFQTETNDFHRLIVMVKA